MSNRRFDAVLFDWDDTLCGAIPHRFHHAQEVTGEFGTAMSLPEVYRAFVRAGDSTVFHMQGFSERLPGELGIDPDLHGAWVHAYRARDAYKRFELFDDVLDLIDHLGHHQLRCAVISNNEEVAHYVEMLDVGHRFELIVSPLTYAVAKPDPEIFRRTLQDMDVAPERAIYVGDSYDNDVIGARAAGMLPVLVDRFGINLDGHDAEHRVETLQALAELLESLIHG